MRRSVLAPTLAVQEGTASNPALCNYDRSNGDILTLIPKCLAERCRACAAPTVAFGARPLKRAGLIRYREDADPVLDSTEHDGRLAWATHSSVCEAAFSEIKCRSFWS